MALDATEPNPYPPPGDWRVVTACGRCGGPVTLHLATRVFAHACNWNPLRPIRDEILAMTFVRELTLWGDRLDAVTGCWDRLDAGVELLAEHWLTLGLARWWARRRIAGILRRHAKAWSLGVR